MSPAIYNELDHFAADWLEKLVEEGHVAPGRVERRSIRVLTPEDLEGATQAHFFAGIGGWSYALRLAGWPDDLPVWTGSCPCQPFSVAGKRKGKNDERHLWPVWFGLIRECRPAIVFGEQVASPDGLDWLDAVSADLEGAGYAFAAADLCAAGVGAPHARQRLYFVAYAHGRPGDVYAPQRREGAGVPHAARQHGLEPPNGCALALADAGGRGRREEQPHEGRGREGDGSAQLEQRPGSGGAGVQLADAVRERRSPWWRSGEASDGRGEARLEPRRLRDVGLVGDASGEGLEGRRTYVRFGPSDAGGGGGESEARGASPPLRAPSGTFPGAVRGFWENAEWIYCTDGKWRPTGPGLFPLAHGVPNRLGTLRGAGNAIVPEVAAGFVSAVMEILGVESEAMEGARA